MKKGHVLIVNGGQLKKEYLISMEQEFQPQFTILADGALQLAEACQIPFTHLVGDFDTVRPDILQKYESMPSIYFERHIPEKDETDSELALDIALRLHPERICILGGTGYRMDHTLGNIELLRKPMEAQIPCILSDEWNDIRMLNRRTVLKKRRDRKYVSFLPYSETVTDLTLTGFRYPLSHAVMKRGEVRGISNEILGEEAVIEFQDGIMLCIESRDTAVRED